MAASKWNVVCIECGKKESFGDSKDVTYAKWTILAWIVDKNEPRVVCDQCDYGDSKKKNKK